MKTIRFFCIGREFFRAEAPLRSTLSRFTLSVFSNFVWCRSHDAVVFCGPTKTTTERLHVSPLSSRPNKGTTSVHNLRWDKYNTAPNERLTYAKCCLRRNCKWRRKKKKTMTDDSTAHECDVFFFFSRSNWHENLLTSRSQRKQITKRFPVVLNKEFGIESELAKIAVVGRSAELV